MKSRKNKKRGRDGRWRKQYHTGPPQLASNKTARQRMTTEALKKFAGPDPVAQALKLGVESESNVGRDSEPSKMAV